MLETADAHSRQASIALGLSQSSDTVLYLILPMYAAQFGMSITATGVILAANRLVRIMGYSWVVRFYSKHGDRSMCALASLMAAICSLGYATLSGFWALFPLRLLWGLSFAALNLATQALATTVSQGAARRSGRSRAYIAAGPLIALPLSAILSRWYGPRAIFFLLTVFALLAQVVIKDLPPRTHAMTSPKRRMTRPNSLDVWSFLEGFTLDGLFIIGLSYLGKGALAGNAVVLAGIILSLRYLGEILLSPIGGHLAERFGPEALLLVFSLLTSLALLGFGIGWLWWGAAVIIILRALQLPLLSPIVARRTPGPGRIQALAERAIWRDIGAGAGPVFAGVLLPHIATGWIYGVPASLLAWAAIACAKSPRDH